jgi:predicted AAA+ superfamily ATPase
MSRVNSYIPRALESTMRRLVEQYPVITLFGPRQSGKTTLAKHLFSDWSYVNLEDFQTRMFAQEDINGFFARYSDCVIIDEVQYTPALLSKIQVLVDKRGQRAGQFILISSHEAHIHEMLAQSLAGRVAVITVMPLSLQELSDNAGPSLHRDDQLIRGFMPRLYEDPSLNATEYWSNYVATYV